MSKVLQNTILANELEAILADMIHPEHFVATKVLSVLAEHPLFSPKSDIEKLKMLSRVINSILVAYPTRYKEFIDENIDEDEDDCGYYERDVDGNYKLYYLYTDGEGGWRRIVTRDEILNYIGFKEERKAE